MNTPAADTGEMLNTINILIVSGMLNPSPAPHLSIHMASCAGMSKECLIFVAS